MLREGGGGVSPGPVRAGPVQGGWVGGTPDKTRGHAPPPPGQDYGVPLFVSAYPMQTSWKDFRMRQPLTGKNVTSCHDTMSQEIRAKQALFHNFFPVLYNIE